MKLYLVCGLPASGKTTFCNVAKEMGYPVVSMGELSRGLWDLLYNPTKTLNEFANKMRESVGVDYCARLIRTYINSNFGDSPIIFIDGVRSQHEVNYFKTHFSDVVVIKIKSNLFLREKRFCHRSDRENTEEYFIRRNDDEQKWGYGNIGADKILNNLYGLDTFKRSSRIYIEISENKPPSYEEEVEKVKKLIYDFFKTNPILIGKFTGW